MRFISILLLLCNNAVALDNWYIFSLDNYSQNIHYWLNSSDPKYNKSLLNQTYQKKRLQELKHRYYGTNNDDYSPWSPNYIRLLLQESPSILDIETSLLSNFDNSKISNFAQLGYGQNKQLYPANWIKSIAINQNLSGFSKLRYDKNNRAIAVNNLSLRILPSDDPFYHSEQIPGEGYPFDNLQNSAIYVGMPLYVVNKSPDGKWLFVISADVAGWVHSDNVALVDEDFIAKWQQVAYQGVIGIIHNNMSIKDDMGNYLFSTYLGTILPYIKTEKSGVKILIPIKNQYLKAQIKSVIVEKSSLSILPIDASPSNIAKILSILQGRIYDWGNINMYNDCSSELKNMYALFGLYIPRNTKSIDKAGSMVDLSNNNLGLRLAYLIKNGVPLLTFIHINGHVALYVGAYDKNYNERSVNKLSPYPLLYQQVWALRDVDQSYRAIIGKSVFLPLLRQYNEDKKLLSQANFSMFRIIYLASESQQNYQLHLDDLLY